MGDAGAAGEDCALHTAIALAFAISTSAGLDCWHECVAACYMLERMLVLRLHQALSSFF
jgi:hypothetical protein